MAPSLIREEYLFPNDSVSVRRHTRLGFISKIKTKQQLNLVQCSCDATVV